MKGYTKLKPINDFLLSGKFSLFASMVFFITFFMVLIFVYFSYQYQINLKYKQLQSTSKRVDYLLANSFDQSGRLMLYIGRHINKNNYKDLNYILSLLKKTAAREYKTSQLWSWSMFDWVDNNNLLCVNRIKGIIADPKDMSHRDYAWKSRENPWTMQFSDPAIGNPSGIWVIPVGIGITNEEEDFLGIITVGFSIAELTEMLLERTQGENVSILVLNNQLKTVLNSDKPNFFDQPDQNVNLSTKDLAQINIQNSGFLNKNYKRDATTFVCYNKMQDFPFTILIGFNYNIWLKDFMLMIFPFILQIFLLGILCVVLMYISRKRIIAAGHHATRATESLIVGINKRSQLHLDTILQFSELLIRQLNGEIQVGVNSSRQLEFLKNIHKSATAVKHIDSVTLSTSTIDLNNVLNNSVDIHSIILLQRKNIINKKLHHEPLLIKVDPLLTLQTMVGLLSHSIHSAPMSSDIFVTTFTERTHAVLEIIYSSLEHNTQEIVRLRSSMGHSDLHINLDYAINLVQMQGGTLNIKSKGIIKIITLVFPLDEVAPSDLYAIG